MEKFLALGFLILLMGCSEGLRPIGTKGSPSGQNCKKSSEAQPESAVNNSVFDISKVDRQAFLEDAHISENEFKVKEAVLLVDRICLQARNSEGLQHNYFLTKNVPIKLKKSSMSVEESHYIQFKKPLTLNQLEVLANQDGCIIGISKNVIMKTFALPNDTSFSNQTHLPAIKYDETYDFYFGAEGVKRDTIIAVIDNGVDINHEDLRSNIWINQAEKNGVSGVDDDQNGYVDDVNGYDFASRVADPNHKYTGSSAGYSHGSHVSGLAAAVTNNTTGVSGVMAKNAKIMALNVFGSSQGASTANIDMAIRYAANMGAKIINMSLGGRGHTATTEEAIKYAISLGSFVVVAAGNDSEVLSSSNFYTPASYGATIDGMVTVGATDANPSKISDICSFSNKSTTYVEIGSSGCDTSASPIGVLATFRQNKYGLMAGTSMASPVAAGVASVVWSYIRDRYNKTLTPMELEVFIKEGSKSFSQISSLIKAGKNTDLSTLKEKIVADFGNNEQPPDDTCK